MYVPRSYVLFFVRHLLPCYVRIFVLGLVENESFLVPRFLAGNRIPLTEKKAAQPRKITFYYTSIYT